MENTGDTALAKRAERLVGQTTTAQAVTSSTPIAQARRQQRPAERLSGCTDPDAITAAVNTDDEQLWQAATENQSNHQLRLTQQP